MADYKAILEKVNAVLPHYLACAYWADLPEGVEEAQFTENARQLAFIDVSTFVRSAYPWLLELSDSDIGHNLWLSRQGHGTGFFDRGFKYADILQEKAEKLGYCGHHITENNGFEFD